MGLATVVTYALIAATATFVGLRDGRRWWALVLVVALLFPLAFSLSRGAWLAAAVGVLVVVALNNWKTFVIFVVIGGLTLVIASGAVSGGSNVVGERFASLYPTATSAPDQSVQDRYAMWQAAQGMWADHPLTGVGLKNFPYFRDLHAPLSYSGGSDIADPGGGFRRVELLSPHNLYFLVLAEQGLLGTFAYGVLFLSLGIAGFRRLQKIEKSSAQRVFGLFSLGFLASYLISSTYGDVGGNTMILNTVLFGSLVWLASGMELDEGTKNKALLHTVVLKDARGFAALKYYLSHDARIHSINC